MNEAQIVVKKGLQIPLKGNAERMGSPKTHFKRYALNLDPFDDLRFRLLAKEQDLVKIGQPLCENKAIFGQNFVSPASGKIIEIKRGLKRRVIDIVIESDGKNEFFEYSAYTAMPTREQLLARLMEGGIFPYIRTRPFDKIASPQHLPRDIFVNCVQTLPYLPSYEMQVKGFEKAFQQGLDCLKILTEGNVHLVYSSNSESLAFLQAKNVQAHTIKGPHPAGTSSFHIHKIAPVQHKDDLVWTLSAIGVIAIGKMVFEGRYHIDRVLALAGEGVHSEKRVFFQSRAGISIGELLENKLEDNIRILSGDPLTGQKVTLDDFLGFYDTAICCLVENQDRESFHFFRFGKSKYTATGAYLSGHIKPPAEGYHFTTNQHGEERPFIDADVYRKVMPMKIPTMELVKAILAEDFELAEQLGILEVAPEDFALPSFICPSKIEMMEIVKEGLRHYAHELGK